MKLPINAVALVLLMVGLVTPPAIAQNELRGNGLVRPKEEETGKTRFFYRASQFYLLGGTALDATSTAIVMSHPTRAFREDGSPLGNYHGVETGWAGFLGRQNTFAAVSANAALNVGVSFASRKLYQRGGKWRYLAIGLNVLKGTDGLVAGINNFRYNGTVDRRVALATGYSGPVVWTH